MAEIPPKFTMKITRICVEASADAIGMPVVPPDRETPLNLSFELERMVARVVDLKKVMDKMMNRLEPFSGSSETACAKGARDEFESLFNANRKDDTVSYVISPNATYKKVGKDGHTTSAWIMKAGPKKTMVPWSFEYLPPKPTLTIYPCITIHLTETPPSKS